LRANHPDLFLIHTGGLFNIATGTDRISSEFILAGMREQRYDAVGVQWKGFAYGLEFPTDSQLPMVASNWPDTTLGKVREIERGGNRIAYFQWLDPDHSPYRKMKGQHFVVNPDMNTLDHALGQARQSGALTILATDMSKKETLDKLPLANVDIAILKSNYELYSAPEIVGTTLMLQPGSRGQRLAELKLQLGDKGRIQHFEHRVTALPSKVKDAPRLNDWYQGYTDALRADYKKRVAHRKAQANQPSNYVGEAACSTCHKQAFDTWKQSRHANAFSTLERENKAFDANCLGCHTVGFNQPGGFIDPDITPDRLNVQCEACHGPGRAHTESDGKRPLQKPKGGSGPVCLQCHNRSHSPSFDFALTLLAEDLSRT